MIAIVTLGGGMGKVIRDEIEFKSKSMVDINELYDLSIIIKNSVVSIFTNFVIAMGCKSFKIKEFVKSLETYRAQLISHIYLNRT